MITIERIFVTDYGDPSVGIFEQEWVITGPFDFETKEEAEEFKKSLQNTFELVCVGIPAVETYEERSARYEEDDRWGNKVDFYSDWD